MYAGTVETYGFTFISGKHFYELWDTSVVKRTVPQCQKHHCQSRLTRRGQWVQVDIDSCLTQLNKTHLRPWLMWGAASPLSYCPLLPWLLQNQARRHLLHVQRQHLTFPQDGAQAPASARLPAWWIWASAFSSTSKSSTHSAGNPDSSIPFAQSVPT